MLSSSRLTQTGEHLGGENETKRVLAADNPTVPCPSRSTPNACACGARPTMPGLWPPAGTPDRHAMPAGSQGMIGKP